MGCVSMIGLNINLMEHLASSRRQICFYNECNKLRVKPAIERLTNQSYIQIHTHTHTYQESETKACEGPGHPSLPQRWSRPHCKQLRLQGTHTQNCTTAFLNTKHYKHTGFGGTSQPVKLLLIGSNNSAFIHYEHNPHTADMWYVFLV